MKKESSGIVISKDDFKKYSFWVIVAFLMVSSYFILKPYLIALISAFILAYLIRPLYLRLEKKSSKTVSALISIVFILTIVLVPLGIVTVAFISQATNFFETGHFTEFAKEISSNPILQEYNINLESLVGKNSPVLGFLKSAFISIPGFAISLLVALFGIFYILVYWEKIEEVIKKFIPFENKEKILKEISEATNIIVYGTFFIGLFEFVISGVVFFALGVKFYLLLAAIIFFLAFIPAGGPALVWVPMMIYNISFGHYAKGVIILVMGIVLSAGIDFFLRAKALGNRSKISPLIMLVGIFGGVSVFGLFGFIIGPLVLAYTIEIVEALVKEH